MTGWQRIADVPVDTGRLVFVDPTNLLDAVDYEDHVLDHPEDIGSTNYELVTNEYSVAVALVFSTGLGDGLYPIEARFEDMDDAVRIAEVRIRFLPHPQIGYQLLWEEGFQ